MASLTVTVKETIKKITEKDTRWNFFMLLGDFILWGTAFALIEPRTVAPDFVGQLTDSQEIVGLSSVIFGSVWLVPQLFAGRIIGGAERKQPWLFWPSVPVRVTMLIVGVIIMALGMANPGAILIVFLIGLALMGFGDGLTSVAWGDMLGSSISDRLRGWLMSLGSVGTSLTVLLISRPIVEAFVNSETLEFPNNYAVLFMISSAILLPTLILFSLVREKPSPTDEDNASWAAYGRSLIRILKEDAPYRRFMITRIMRAFAMFASGFYIGYITSEVGFERENVIAESLALLTAGKVLMALLNGRILAKSGTRLVIVLSALQNTAYMALMLLTPALGITAIRLVYFFMGMQDATIMSGYFAWSIEYAPDNKRPVYIGLTNTASLVSSFAPVLGGFILERSSYPAIFALGLGAAVIVLALALSLVEPRRAKMKR